MNTDTIHSPLPWRILGKPNCLSSHTIFFGHGEHTYNQICQCSNLEDAKLIINAVNTHAHLVESNRRLVEACKLALIQITSDNNERNIDQSLRATEWQIKGALEGATDRT